MGTQLSLGEQFEAVLAEAQAGAPWAVEALYRDLHPALLRYLRSQEAGEGEDLESEAWIDVARGLRRFQGGEADFRRWVFTIARRRLIDHRRKVGRRHTQPLLTEALADCVQEGDAEAEAMASLTAQAALARIAALPPDQAEVVMLRVVAGFTASEVAAIMGKRPGTIRVLQHRALSRLARDLTREVVTP